MRRAERERIDTLLRAYAAKTPPGPQTITDYARAAGVEWHIARRHLRALGIAVSSGPSADGGPARDPEHERPPLASEGRAPGDPPPQPPESPGPAAPSTRPPAIPPEIMAEIRRMIEQAIVPVRGLPAAVGEEVRKVTGQIAEGQGKSPEEAAEERARRQVSKETETWVVGRASAMHTWMERTGETVYQFWNDRGLRSKYEDGPGKMVEDALAFWWRYCESGRFADLWDIIDELRAERDDLARRVYELTDYQNVYERQFQLGIEPMARAFMVGLPVSLEVADGIMRVAQELAERRARTSPPIIVKLPD